MKSHGPLGGASPPPQHLQVLALSCSGCSEAAKCRPSGARKILLGPFSRGLHPWLLHAAAPRLRTKPQSVASGRSGQSRMSRAVTDISSACTKRPPNTQSLCRVSRNRLARGCALNCTPGSRLPDRARPPEIQPSPRRHTAMLPTRTAAVSSHYSTRSD